MPATALLALLLGALAAASAPAAASDGGLGGVLQYQACPIWAVVGCALETAHRGYHFAEWLARCILNPYAVCYIGG